MAKTLHVLGGGEWQVPTIARAKALGHLVLVTDRFPERPGYALADDHEAIDIADRERTLEAARRRRVDGILCDTTDVGVPTAAWVAERLGLPGMGHEVALNFTDKGRMRAITAEAGLHRVRFRLVRSQRELFDAASDFGLPVVVKPPDSQASRGVRRVDRTTGLPAAFAGASSFARGGAVLVEEFLPGIEATVEGFCRDGRVHTLGISDKDHFPSRPEVACRLTYPAAFAPDTMERIRSLNEAVVRALGLKDGVTHAEYMVEGGSVSLVEIAARGGGSRIHSHIAPWLSGVDVPGAAIGLALGESPAIEPRPGTRAANLEFFLFPPGRVRRIEGLEEARAIPGVAEILLEFREGGEIRPPEDDRTRPGMMVVFGHTREEVLAISEKVKATVRVTVE